MGGSGREGQAGVCCGSLLSTTSDFHIDASMESSSGVGISGERPCGCDRCESVTWEELGWYRATPYRQGRARPRRHGGRNRRVPAQVLRLRGITGHVRFQAVYTGVDATLDRPAGSAQGHGRRRRERSKADLSPIWFSLQVRPQALTSTTRRRSWQRSGYQRQSRPWE